MLLFALALLAADGFHPEPPEMLDISDRDLQRADSTFGLLVMFGSRHCEPCATLRPHLTALQLQLNSDGIAVLMGALDTDRYSQVADELGITHHPSFAFYAAQDAKPPRLYTGGSSMRELLNWVLETYEQARVRKGSASPYRPRTLADTRMMHPNAERVPGHGRTSVLQPLLEERAPAPENLRPATPVECGGNARTALAVIGGQLELAVSVGAERESTTVAVAVGAWDATGARFVPLGQPQSAEGTATRTGGGTLAGDARVLARNRTGCIFAAGTLRPDGG
jgi:thiol-disulfide isomerase/thioredoxin